MNRKCGLVIGIAVAICLASGSEHANAERVYELDSLGGPSFSSPGWTYFGGTFTITTGFVGDVTAANVSTTFTDWSIFFRSPHAGGTTYELTPVNSSIHYFDGIGTNLRIDSTAIAFPEASGDTLAFFGTQSVEYFPDLIQLDDLDSDFSPAQADLRPPTLIATAIPEPNASWLLALVAVACLVHRYRTGIFWRRSTSEPS